MTSAVEDLRRAAAHVFVEDLDTPVLSPDDGHHLGRVLRLRTGEPVTVSDGRGSWRATTVASAGAGVDVVLEVSGPIRHEREPEPPVAIGFVVPKGDRPEWIVQKLTEIGVDRLMPLSSARSVVRWDPDKAVRQVERLRKVGREAAMQSRRVRLPQIDDLTPLAAGLDALEPLGGVALAEPGGSPVGGPAAPRAVLIGPEGGWTPEELAAHPTVDLGPNVLRAETAALVAAVLLVSARSA